MPDSKSTMPTLPERIRAEFIWRDVQGKKLAYQAAAEIERLWHISVLNRAEWIKAAEAAINGDMQPLRSRVELARSQSKVWSGS